MLRILGDTLKGITLKLTGHTECGAAKRRVDWSAVTPCVRPAWVWEIAETGVKIQILLISKKTANLLMGSILARFVF